MCYFLLLIAVNTQAQTADEIINNYNKSIGGLEAWKKIRTLEMTGTLTVMGLDIPVKITIVADSAIRTEAIAMGNTIISAYADGKGWVLDPITKPGSKPTAMDADMVKQMQSEARVVSDLMDYKSRGHQVSVSSMTIEGIDCWHIQLTKNDGAILFYNIIKKEGVFLMSEKSTVANGTKITSQTWYSNIKTFGGLKFATTLDVKIDGDQMQTTTYDSIELNKPVDKKIFVIPAQ